jgi:hypothetical protein
VVKLCFLSYKIIITLVLLSVKTDTMWDQYPRIYISRTQKEWDLIDKKVIQLGKENVNAYIRSKIPQLKNDYKECPECLCAISGERKQRHQYLRADQFEILAEISRITGITEGVIVNKLIIEPLLFMP